MFNATRLHVIRHFPPLSCCQMRPLKHLSSFILTLKRDKEDKICSCNLQIGSSFPVQRLKLLHFVGVPNHSNEMLLKVKQVALDYGSAPKPFTVSSISRQPFVTRWWSSNPVNLVRSILKETTETSSKTMMSSRRGHSIDPAQQTGQNSGDPGVEKGPAESRRHDVTGAQQRGRPRNSKQHCGAHGASARIARYFTGTLHWSECNNLKRSSIVQMWNVAQIPKVLYFAN